MIEGPAASESFSELQQQINQSEPIMKLDSLCSLWICVLNEHAFIDEPQQLLDSGK